jgi:hypothetical protein
VLKSSDESSAPVTEGKRICSVKWSPNSRFIVDLTLFGYQCLFLSFGGKHLRSDMDLWYRRYLRLCTCSEKGKLAYPAVIGQYLWNDPLMADVEDPLKGNETYGGNADKGRTPMLTQQW